MSNSQPPASVDLETTWAFLEEGIDHLMTNSLTGSVSYAKHMSLTTAVFNYCSSSTRFGSVASGESSGRTKRREYGKYTSSRVGFLTIKKAAHGANLMGAELYKNLIQYFVTHLNGPRDQTESLQDETLLRYYAAEWSRYTNGAHRVDRIFMHLNRHWTTRERDEGRKHIYPVYTLALVQWKDTLFVPIQMKLTAAILRLIEDQRNGSAIDQDLVKKVVDSFVSLGLDDTDTNKECLDVYKDHFELPFIDATEKYYKQEAETFLASHSLSDYLKEVEEHLRQEEDRVDRYLNGQTRQPLISKCEQVLIRERAALMWDSFQGLLDSDRDEDLQRMYSLLSRIPEGLEPLQKKFEEHVEKTGLAAISKLVGEAGSSTESLDPKVFVDALLDIHQKYSETVTKSFRGDSGFVESLDKACREFVNRNSATGQSHSKSRELIVQYADLLLREDKKPAEEGNLEAVLNRVMVLFKYIEDGNTLRTFYQTELSKRHGISSSVESEGS